MWFRFWINVNFLLRQRATSWNLRKLVSPTLRLRIPLRKVSFKLAHLILIFFFFVSECPKCKNPYCCVSLTCWRLIIQNALKLTLGNYVCVVFLTSMEFWKFSIQTLPLFGSILGHQILWQNFNHSYGFNFHHRKMLLQDIAWLWEITQQIMTHHHGMIIEKIHCLISV